MFPSARTVVLGWLASVWLPGWLAAGLDSLIFGVGASWRGCCAAGLAGLAGLAGPGWAGLALWARGAGWAGLSGWLGKLSAFRSTRGLACQMANCFGQDYGGFVMPK